MNPWKIIGWIVLAGIALMLTFCAAVLYRVGDAQNSSAQATPAASSPEAPSHSVKVVSVECQDNYGRNRADVTVTNIGITTIPYAKVFVQFKDDAGNVLSAQDGYLNPHDISPGATASATVYSSGGGSKSCSVVAVQDKDGNAVALQ